MVHEETDEQNVQIYEQFQDFHIVENHKYLMHLTGNDDEEYDSDSSKSSTTSFLRLNLSVMSLSTTHTTDKVQYIFEILDTRAIQDSDDSDSDNFTRESESQRLQRDMRNRSVQFAITHVASSALFTFLKAHDGFKALPSDARPLKDNPTYIQLKHVHPGT